MNTSNKCSVVYVVSYQPFQDKCSTGGFDWYYCPITATEKYYEEIKQIGDCSIIRLLAATVPYGDLGFITEWLDDRLDGVEITWPVLRQHQPQE